MFTAVSGPPGTVAGKLPTCAQPAPLMMDAIPSEPPPVFWRVRLCDEGCGEAVGMENATRPVSTDNCGAAALTVSETVTLCGVDAQLKPAPQVNRMDA